MSFDTVTITGGVPFTAELYKPSGTATTGLVVIAYGTHGRVDPWTGMMRGYAQDLASRGLFALMPDYFARTGTSHGGAAAREIADSHHDWSAALVDTVTYARTLPQVDPTRIGMLGFSLGGYLCLRARAAAKPKALVEYFAPAFEGIGAKGTLAHAQIHHGTLDQVPTQFANAERIESLLKLECPDVELFPYKGATHGFAGTDTANTDAAAKSKQRTVTFFQTRL